MAENNVYIAVDHAHGDSVPNNFLESLMQVARYEDVKFQERYVTFKGGNPEADVMRWYRQGQTKVSIIHIECNHLGDNFWDVAINFYANRGLSKRVSPRGKLRYTYRGVPGPVLVQVMQGIAEGGFPAMRNFCTGPLVQFAQ